MRSILLLILFGNFWVASAQSYNFDLLAIYKVSHENRKYNVMHLVNSRDPSYRMEFWNEKASIRDFKTRKTHHFDFLVSENDSVTFNYERTDLHTKNKNLNLETDVRFKTISKDSLYHIVEVSYYYKKKKKPYLQAELKMRKHPINLINVGLQSLTKFTYTTAYIDAEYGLLESATMKGKSKRHITLVRLRNIKQNFEIK